MRTALAVLRKDLLLELRTFETVPAMALFSLATFVIFHFGLNRATVGRSARRRRPDRDAAVRRAARRQPAVRGRARAGRLRRVPARAGRPQRALLVAKAAALFVFLAVLELVAVPAFALLLLGPSLGPRAARADRGARARRRRHRGDRHARVGDRDPDPRPRPDRPDHRAAAADPGADRHRAGGRAAAAGRSHAPPPGKWLAILALYDLVFALVAYAVFDFLLED